MEDNQSKTDLNALFGHISDEQWKQLVLRSIKDRDVEGASFPKYSHFARLGSKDAVAGVEEAFNLYSLCKPYLTSLLQERDDCAYLDFGCGAGRIFRTFLKDFKQSKAIGVDCVGDLVEVCRADFDGYRFEVIPERPPTQLTDASVDVITAYSVFSHFSAIQNTRWINEFARLMRPGGYAFLTTYGQGHLNYLKQADDTQIPGGHLRQKKEIEGVGGFEEVNRVLRLGEMMYFITGNPSYKPYDYGWAFLGPEFVRRAWGANFELVEFIDQYDRLEQALVVLRRKP